MCCLSSMKYIVFVFIVLSASCDSGVGERHSAFELLRVAHAAGGVQGDVYTNSMEALNLSYSLGFKNFEIDLIFTSDDKLICLHDWSESFENIFGFRVDAPLTLASFEELVSLSGKYRPCTLSTLHEWMLTNESFLITDVKGDNLKALNFIVEIFENELYRVIPQVYNVSEFKYVEEMGFDVIIWTLYRQWVSDEFIIEFASNNLEKLVVTMPKSRVDSGLSIRLAGLGVPVYVHTINDFSEMVYYKDVHMVSEIYTDWLFPDGKK